MAEQTQLIRLRWENGVNFEMESKHGDASWITVIQMHENGYLTDLWENAQKVCETFFNRTINDVGNEMKAP